MCYQCWQERGAPKLDSPKIREAVRLIGKVYEHSVVGGNLHVVVDDWNLEDDDMEFCSRQIDISGRNPDECTPEQLAVERQCCDALMALSEDERASALAIYDEFV